MFVGDVGTGRGGLLDDLDEERDSLLTFKSPPSLRVDNRDDTISLGAEPSLATD